MITAPINAMQNTAIPASGKMAASSRMPRFSPGTETKESAGAAIVPGETQDEVSVALSRPSMVDKATERRDSANGRAPVDQAQQIRERIDELNARATAVQFKVDNENNRLVVSVVSRETGETIRQIPPEELLKLQDALKEMRGVLISEKH